MELYIAEQLAWDKMKEYGLVANRWTFDFLNSKNVFGRVYYQERILLLSADLVLLNDEPEIMDTILHEIAHALAGPGAKHGPVWQRYCRELGCRPEARYDPDKHNVNMPKKKFIGVCPNGHKIEKDRLPKGMRGCGKCSKTFDERYLFIFTLNNQ